MCEEIGKGEFSTVRKARTKANSVVAIKRIVPKTGSQKAQTILEKALKFPKHDNVVQILDLYSHVDLPRLYLVLEHFESQNLNEYLIPRKVDNDEKLLIIEEIAKGLKFLHDKGLPHGDVRPQNVLVGWNKGKRVCKVTDYAVTYIQKIGAKSRLRKLNEYFADPATAKTGKVTVNSDMFSFGELIFVIIAEPIKSEGDKKLLVPAMNIGEEAYTLSRLSQEDVLGKVVAKDLGDLDRLATVIVLMLQMDPEHRPNIDFVLSEVTETKAERRRPANN